MFLAPLTESLPEARGGMHATDSMGRHSLSYDLVKTFKTFQFMAVAGGKNLTVTYNGVKRRRKFPFTPHTTLRLNLVFGRFLFINVSILSTVTVTVDKQEFRLIQLEALDAVFSTGFNSARCSV